MNLFELNKSELEYLIREEKFLVFGKRGRKGSITINDARDSYKDYNLFNISYHINEVFTNNDKLIVFGISYDKCKNKYKFRITAYNNEVGNDYLLKVIKVDKKMNILRTRLSLILNESTSSKYFIKKKINIFNNYENMHKLTFEELAKIYEKVEELNKKS